MNYVMKKREIIVGMVKDMSENESCPNGVYYYTVELKDGRNQKGSFNIFR